MSFVVCVVNYKRKVCFVQRWFVFVGERIDRVLLCVFCWCVICYSCSHSHRVEFSKLDIRSRVLLFGWVPYSSIGERIRLTWHEKIQLIFISLPQIYWLLKLAGYGITAQWGPTTVLLLQKKKTSFTIINFSLPIQEGCYVIIAYIYI